MTSADFIVAFGIIVVVIFFAVFYVSNNFSNELNYLTTLELKESGSNLNQLIEENLYDNFNKIKSDFKEIGNYAHREKVGVSLEPATEVSKVHVYDELMNEIPTEPYVAGNKLFVFFWLDFESGEERFIDIFYYGGSTTNIKYLGDPVEINVTGKMLSEYDVKVISQTNCGILQSSDYEQVKESLGFRHQFKLNLTDCEYGPNPPETTIVVKQFPLLLEKSNEIISSEIAKVMVW
jgi:hypothetical protein